MTVSQGDGGFAVFLDGRPVRTPARNVCALPTQAMADVVAAEWQTQEGDVHPLSMPMTRAAATCLDRVAPELQGVRETIAAYGGTDLLCYRADYPEGLVVRQSEGWDPVLRWSAETFGAQLNTGTGVMHIAQPPAALASLAGQVAALDAWALTCLSELVTISGSLLLGLAVGQKHLDPELAWELARIDDQWNIDEWGEDQEAAEQAARKQADFLHAAKVWDMLPDN